MRFTSKTDSDTSSGSSSSSSSSSPSRGQAYYYVQAPSSDSPDGDKSSSSSMQSSPVSNSPVDSPSHPSLGKHSRDSSSESRKSSIFSSPSWIGRGNHKKIRWPPVILEEGSSSSYNKYKAEKRFIKRLRMLIALFIFMFLFTVLCLILWGASRPYKADITVTSLTLNNFYVGEGSDFSGVVTTMVTLNGSLQMNIYNPAPFFGIHVTSNLINLAFWEITIATGQIRKYYQPRKSHRIVLVNLKGNSIPIYGAGSNFKLYGPTRGQIPLSLQFEVQARADVVGKLVQTRHNKIITCIMVADSSPTTKPIIFRKDNCAYV